MQSLEACSSMLLRNIHFFHLLPANSLNFTSVAVIRSGEDSQVKPIQGYLSKLSEFSYTVLSKVSQTVKATAVSV
jgi:hypothetical protein